MGFSPSAVFSSVRDAVISRARRYYDTQAEMKLQAEEVQKTVEEGLKAATESGALVALSEHAQVVQASIALTDSLKGTLVSKDLQTALHEKCGGDPVKFVTDYIPSYVAHYSNKYSTPTQAPPCEVRVCTHHDWVGRNSTSGSAGGIPRAVFTLGLTAANHTSLREELAHHGVDPPTFSTFLSEAVRGWGRSDLPLDPDPVFSPTSFLIPPADEAWPVSQQSLACARLYTAEKPARLYEILNQALRDGRMTRSAAFTHLIYSLGLAVMQMQSPPTLGNGSGCFPTLYRGESKQFFPPDFYEVGKVIVVSSRTCGVFRARNSRHTMSRAYLWPGQRKESWASPGC
jgi:hypothetical protein